MKALTVWQPWASLIAEGCKPFEFRGYAPPVSIIGTRIAIHAGKRAARKAEIAELLLALKNDPVPPGFMDRDSSIALLERVIAAPASLPHSAILCTVILGDPKPPHAVAAMANDSNRNGHFNWAWPMLSPERLTPPQPASGLQGFWTWDGPTA